jgi:hypothetical protein
MEVIGVSSQITPVIQTETVHQTNPAVEEIPQEQPQGSEIPESEATEQSEDGQAKGVIRNLLEGHYKGVADVRLRINHFEELAAIESAQLKALAEQEVAGLLGVVESGVNNILGSSETFTAQAASNGEGETEPVNETLTVSGLHDEFVGAVNILSEKFVLAETPSINDLVGGIENAFTDFVTFLSGLLVRTEENPTVVVESEGGQAGGSSGISMTGTQEPTASSPEGEQPAGVEIVGGEPEPPVVEVLPQAGYISLIDELSAAFEAAKDELIEALNGFQLLPELSEPSGNGVAYEKFLAIYNQMQTVETAEGDTSGNEEVDTVA